MPAGRPLSQPGREACATLASADLRARHADDADMAAAQLEIGRGTFQKVRRDGEHLFAQLLLAP